MTDNLKDNGVVSNTIGRESSPQETQLEETSESTPTDIIENGNKEIVTPREVTVNVDNDEDEDAEENDYEPFEPQSLPLSNTENSSSPVCPNNTDDDTTVNGEQVPLCPAGYFPPPCPPGLEVLLEATQVVVHKDRLRKNLVINMKAEKRLEVVDETRRVLFHVEQEPSPNSSHSFQFKIYDRDENVAMEVYNPLSSVCFCCKASWRWCDRCRFQAVIYSPPGVVAGSITQSKSFFVQQFDILSPQEDVLLVLRGGPRDLELHTPDFSNEIGRMSIHGWVGIMHEIRRTSEDVGLTFPMDLDVRVKGLLIGSIFAVDWLYSTKGGKTR